MCPLICSIKKRGGDFANTIMQRVKNPFWEDVFKHYKKLCGKCMPVTFDDFDSECLHYNVNICRGERMIFIRKWIDCGIISFGQLFGPDGYLTYNEFKAKFHNVNPDYSLYEGVISVIKCYQKKLGIKWKDDFAVDDALSGNVY